MWDSTKVTHFSSHTLLRHNIKFMTKKKSYMHACPIQPKTFFSLATSSKKKKERKNRMWKKYKTRGDWYLLERKSDTHGSECKKYNKQLLPTNIKCDQSSSEMFYRWRKEENIHKENKRLECAKKKLSTFIFLNLSFSCFIFFLRKTSSNINSAIFSISFTYAQFFDQNFSFDSTKKNEVKLESIDRLKKININRCLLWRLNVLLSHLSSFIYNFTHSI